MRAKVSPEWRERLRALWRFIVLAVQPWPLRWARMADFAIAILGAVAALIVGIVEQSPLGGAVVFLGVSTTLLLIGGMRLEREFHGDAGIQVEPRIRGNWIELGVVNSSSKAADFGAAVQAIEPVPASRYMPSWTIPWATSPEARQTIDPHSTQHLRLGHGEVTRRDRDGELAGSIAFECLGRGEVPFNYENTSEFDGRAPIKVTVQVYRVSSRCTVTREFQISLHYEEDQDRAYPRIEPVGAPQPA